MERKFLFLTILLSVNVIAFGQVPSGENLNSERPFNIDEMVFKDHIAQIIHSKEIRKKVCIRKLFTTTQVYVSIGERSTQAPLRPSETIANDGFEIYLMDCEEMFFNIIDKYLRVINVQQINDDLLYEVITHSGGQGKTSEELYCMFNFQLIDKKYQLVKTSFNEVRKSNVKEY
jgi:hypothetical protein